MINIIIELRNTRIESNLKFKFLHALGQHRGLNQSEIMKDEVPPLIGSGPDIPTCVYRFAMHLEESGLFPLLRYSKANNRIEIETEKAQCIYNTHYILQIMHCITLSPLLFSSRQQQTDHQMRLR